MCCKPYFSSIPESQGEETPFLGEETPFLGDETLVLFESPVHDTVTKEPTKEPDSLLAETN